MARASSQDVIVLGKRRRKRLERIVARASSPQHLVLRARIVLAAWRREANEKIARDLRVCVDTVRKWRHRFRREGMPGLFAPFGSPPVYGTDDQLLIVATVTQAPPQVDAQWTHRGWRSPAGCPSGCRRCSRRAPRAVQVCCRVPLAAGGGAWRGHEGSAGVAGWGGCCAASWWASPGAVRRTVKLQALAGRARPALVTGAARRPAGPIPRGTSPAVRLRPRR
jgi:Homeodomain-like domain